MLTNEVPGAFQKLTEPDWRTLPALQQPEWPDPVRLAEVLVALQHAPGLVDPAECDQLSEHLAAVARGEGFLLQGGDCAERLDDAREHRVNGKLRVLRQMAVVLTYATTLPVVTVGRIAGQYAKPRSAPFETRDGVTLPAYRGDAVNDAEFSAAARTPDPSRLLRMYEASAATLESLRRFDRTDLHQLHEWNQDFVGDSPAGEVYEPLASEMGRALRFMQACGVEPGELRTTELFASHEGLLLDYEAALTRLDPRTGRMYATSGHMIWIGERTRDLDSAHVAYAATVNNPIGVKLGPTITPDIALGLIDALDPSRKPGRLTFIVRMGAREVRDRLPVLVEKVTASGAEIVWACDPMHGNTFVAPSGHKTRRFNDILDEVAGFFEVHRALGTHAGGIHVELTGDDVTECVGGGTDIHFADLPKSYQTACDPRLNRGQSLDLAFLVAEMLTP